MSLLNDKEAIIRIAKALNGPWFDKYIGPEKLQEIRDYKWINQTSNSERAVKIQEATAAIKQIEHELKS